MSKVSKNIKMLDILSSGKRYSCSYLAEVLEVSPRMIRSYKEELEKEGFYIESYLGVNGGYQLKQNIDMPDVLFNNYDVDLLDELIKEAPKYRNKLDNIKSKIVRYLHLIDNDTTFLSYDKQSILNDINIAISNKESLEIEYFSKGVLKMRKVIPKQVFLYNDLVMIVVQYSEDINDIRHINLNRIEKIIK